MAKMHKLEEDVELKCKAAKIFEMLRSKQPEIPELCSNKIASIEAHQGDWLTVGSTRKWDLIIGGKSSPIVDRIDEIDEENMILTRSVIDGDMMKHYKSLISKIHAISKDNGNSCVVKCSLEYEKLTENAPEPHDLFNLGVSVLRELAPLLSGAN
ncbi:hypothetical protein vseg_002087 [Gypsophila vaccaria]